MLLLALLSILPHDTASRDTFDVAEINHVHSWSAINHENGDVDHELKYTFTQILLRRWNGEQHVIEAWRMQKPGMQPTYSHTSGRYELRWHDGQTERVIYARSLGETSADFDREVTERNCHPKEWRRELRK
jgi:hypothetical protein